MPVTIISLDGNIGAGKTRLLKELIKTTPGVLYLHEPLHTWEQIVDPVTGKNILECFYMDNAQHAFTMQATALISRYESISRAVAEGATTIVMERSLATDANVFAAALYKDGLITDLQWEVYKQWNKVLYDTNPVNAIVYINTPPDICMQHIGIRNRPGEDRITPAMLQSYDEHHRTFIDKFRSKCTIVEFSHSTPLDQQVEAVRALLSSFN